MALNLLAFILLAEGFNEPQPCQENTLHIVKELPKPFTVENNKHSSL